MNSLYGQGPFLYLDAQFKLTWLETELAGELYWYYTTSLMNTGLILLDGLHR